MNTIITGRTNPNIRFKLQGVHLCERLNSFLQWKKQADVIYFILLQIIILLYNK
jgi:hypothetical protein